MRIFLLPVSTRRTLLYCERVAADVAKTTAAQAPAATATIAAQAAAAAAARSVAPAAPAAAAAAAASAAQAPAPARPPTAPDAIVPAASTIAAPSRTTALMEKAQTRAAKLWSDWEQKPAGSWQHRVVTYGNAGLRRVAFEEWGLKSVPPLSTRERQHVEGGGGGVAPVEVIYPASVIPPHAVAGLLHRLGTEREALHRKRLIWCFVGMPLSAPAALVPVIPNLPFFYLVYRAWSHWRAFAGGKHIQFLLQNRLVTFAPSPVLDAIYAEEKPAARWQPLPAATPDAPTASRTPQGSPAGASTAPTEESEQLLLSHPRATKAIAEAFGSHMFETELERAIWQIETALKKKAKKEELEREDEEEEQSWDKDKGGK